MNIAEAKEQIKKTVSIYLKKDEYGNYRIPAFRQRPIFLLGAPGIGKTAIMKQIAGELNISLVSYSMIHHTRQSALGLPYITEKQYGGKTVSVSEYTMSEIIASVYNMIHESGIEEGILFLDEVNCVSETLAPAMLQFLQFKTFGCHALPEGWVVVTAGNPPEYNRSARRFDVVTLDRLKVMRIEADQSAWNQYAYETGVHGSILSYLALKKADFCAVETTVDGRSFVTPRGWDDLSVMMKEYEAADLAIDETLIGQYIGNQRIAKDFAAYYLLYRKYRSDYRIHEILQGQYDEALCAQAAAAGFDERISLLGLLIAAVNEKMNAVSEREAELQMRFSALKSIKANAESGKTEQEAIAAEVSALERKLQKHRHSSALTVGEQLALDRTMAALKQHQTYEALKSAFKTDVDALGEFAETVKAETEQLFGFTEKAFGEGNEMLFLVTELTANRKAVAFIGKYGCEGYFSHHRKLLFYDRKEEIEDALKSEINS